MVNKRTHNRFLESKCKLNRSNGWIVQNFIQIGTSFQLKFKKKSRNNFKQKVTAELLKRHEKVQIDTRVAGFSYLFSLYYFEKTEPKFLNWKDNNVCFINF